MKRSGIIGPTASMIPDAFFQRGISVIAGVRISDPERMAAILKQGGSAYHLLRECCEKTAFVMDASLRNLEEGRNSKRASAHVKDR